MSSNLLTLSPNFTTGHPKRSRRIRQISFQKRQGEKNKSSRRIQGHKQSAGTGKGIRGGGFTRRIRGHKQSIRKGERM
jgi:hypothetical protein